MVLDCQAHFGSEVFLYKMDKEAWHRRIRLDASASILLAHLIHVNDIPHVVLPTAQQFGVQESVYQSEFAGRVIDCITAAREIASHGRRTSLLYADDQIGCLPPPLISADIVASTADANRLSGKNAINIKKTFFGDTLEVIGFSISCSRRVLTHSLKSYLTIICILFVELPTELTCSTRVSIKLFQRLSSYMIRLADVIFFLRPFSRGASRNTAGRTNNVAFLQPDTITDIWFWRTIFRQTNVCNISWMSLPLFVPPLFRHSKHDDLETQTLRSTAQAAHASHSLHVDSTLKDLGFLFASAILFLFWGSFQLPPCLFDLDFDNIDKDASINIKDFFGAVASLALVAPFVAGTPGHLTHIHIFTDNTSALSWMIKFRSSHPLVSSLLQLFSHLQIRHHLLVTMSHIAGEKNIYADAASRNFEVPNGQDLLAKLGSATRLCSFQNGARAGSPL